MEAGAFFFPASSSFPQEGHLLLLPLLLPIIRIDYPCLFPALLLLYADAFSCQFCFLVFFFSVLFLHIFHRDGIYRHGMAYAMDIFHVYEIFLFLFPITFIIHHRINFFSFSLVKNIIFSSLQTDAIHMLLLFLMETFYSLIICIFSSLFISFLLHFSVAAVSVPGHMDTWQQAWCRQARC